MTIPFEGPPEAVADALPQRLPRVAAAVAAAALAALLLGSGGLLRWAEALPVGPTSDILVDVAADWRAAARRLGLERAEAALQAAMAAARRAR